MVNHKQPALLSKEKQAGSLLDLLNIREIQDGCLCTRPPGSKTTTKEREYQAVLRIDPLNFSLMSEREQEAILESFRVLLQRQAIGELLSIHIRILPYDLSPYRQAIAQAKTQATSDLLRDMATEHERFVLNLASRHAILERQFYIRVHAPSTKKNAPFARHSRRQTPQELFEKARSALDRRCADLLQDIERCGLTAHRLTDYELAQYYASCIHTHYAERYPIQPILLEALDRPSQAARLPYPQSSETPQQEASSEQSETQITHPKTTSTDTASPSHRSILSSQDTVQSTQQQPHAKRRWWQKPSHTQNRSEPTPYTTLAEVLEPALLSQQENYIRIHRESSEYFRARVIKGYPAYVIAGWLDRLIQIDEPYMDILLFAETLDPTSYTASLSRSITNYRATQSLEQRSGRTENPYIEEARSQVEQLRQKIVQQVERVHSVTLMVASRAATISELKARDEKLVSLLRSLDLDHVELSLEHLQAWQCILPDATNLLGNHRKILDTSTLVTAFPFSSSSLATEPGSLYGVMPGGGLVIINPSSPSLDNGHEVKFARSGSGKSYHEKVVLARRLLMGYHSIVVDPEDEYLSLCQKVGGINVRLSSGALQVNPFELPQSDNPDRNILEEKIQSLLVLFDLLLADKHLFSLTQREKSFLSKALNYVYAKAGITSEGATHTRTAPNMKQFYETLIDGSCGRDEFDLADRLLRHLHAFPDHTIPLSTNNSLLVFNIRDLSDELRPVGTYMIIDYAWTLVRSEKHPKPRQFILDEAWTLLQFENAGRHLAELCRRARKYNLSLRITSQNAEDFLNSEAGRVILTNASMKFLMKQDPASIDQIQQAFHLSEGERKFLLACQRGEGLFFCGQSHVPIKVIASELEHQLATTNPQEKQLQEEQTITNHTPEDHIRQAQTNENDEYTRPLPRLRRHGPIRLHHQTQNA